VTERSAPCQVCGTTVIAPGSRGPFLRWCDGCRPRCAWNGCGKLVDAKGYCRNHYQQWRKRLAPPSSAECVQCGITYERPKRSGPFGLCSDTCRLARKKARARQWHAEHREESNRAAREWPRKNRERTRERVNAWDRAHPDHKRRRKLVRRARLAAVRIEPYRPTEIYERDGWVCQLCLEPIPPDVGGKWNPMRASIDHRIPLALGGADAPDNVQASHLVCNIRKGARVA
jgi:hypothetical protein